MKRQPDLQCHHPHGSQTKHSYSTTCVWFSFGPFLPTLTLLSFFFSLFFRESGRREQEVAGLCLIPFLNSAPQLLWSETGAGICLRLYRFPSSHPDPPFFLLIPYQPFLWKTQQEEFTGRIMSEGPACIHST